MNFIFFLFFLMATFSWGNSNNKIATASRSQGPGDGGGGDTCNGKLIESFKTDITQLQEYKKYITPIIDKISPGVFKDVFTLRDLLEPNNKSWYLVECKLQDVPKSKKGLYLDSYQTAFQNDREVFVDLTSYSKMNPENKAKLLLHEMLMALYLTNNISTNDLCQLKSVQGKCIDDKLETQYATIKLGKRTDLKNIETVDLNAKAHQNIRALVDWTWSNKNYLTEASFTKKSLEYKYDNWFTSISRTPDPNPDEILDLSDVTRSFQKHELSKKNITFCGFDKELKKFKNKCDIKIKFERKKVEDQFSTVSISFEAKRSSDGKIFKFNIENTSLPSQAANIFRYNLSETESGASLRFIKDIPEIINGKLPSIGHLTQVLIVDFNKISKDELEIRSVSLKIHRWYSFEKTAAQKGNLKYMEVFGYNSLAVDLSEVFAFEINNIFSLSGVGSYFDSKRSIGYIPN